MIIVITDSTTEPVTLNEAKTWLGIDLDVTTHDADITACIAAARKKVEQLSGLSLSAKTLKLIINDYNDTYIDMPYPPTVSITSVKTYDSEGTATTYVDGSDYHLIANRLMFSGNGDITEIIYTTGSNAEEFFKLAIKKQLAFDYKNESKDNGFDEEVSRMISSVTLNLGY